MEIKIINLGRQNINRTAEVDTSRGLVNDSLEDTLVELAGHYLLSSDVDVEPNGKPGGYNVYAGFHRVGELEIVSGIPLPIK